MTLFLSAIWIVVRAPSGLVWLFAVAASEWSLWIAGIALVGVVPVVYILISRAGGKLIVASTIIGAAAFVISLYPSISSLAVARANHVSLSPFRYFSGPAVLFSSTDTFAPEIRTFAHLVGQDLNLDLYRPAKGVANNGAAIVVIHGGSWARGVRSDFPQWNAMLAKNGYTVFDIDYRLSPQPNYLTATGDVKCAMAWVRQHANEFDISPDRIAIMGRSAGAHLALLAAYSTGDERLPSSCSENGPPVNARAVISLYGPTDLLWAYDNPANQMVIDGPQTLADLIGGSPHDSAEIRDRFRLASPTSHVNSSSPPTLLIHGGHDQLVREENMDLLDQRLTIIGVPHRTVFIPYAQHGFDYNINGWGSQVTEKVLLEFLKENTGQR